MGLVSPALSREDVLVGQLAEKEPERTYVE